MKDKIKIRLRELNREIKNRDLKIVRIDEVIEDGLIEQEYEDLSDYEYHIESLLDLKEKLIAEQDILQQKHDKLNHQNYILNHLNFGDLK